MLGGGGGVCVCVYVREYVLRMYVCMSVCISAASYTSAYFGTPLADMLFSADKRSARQRCTEVGTRI